MASPLSTYTPSHMSAGPQPPAPSARTRRSKLAASIQSESSASSSSTTKPRPTKTYSVCRYFPTQRGCYNADKCRFLHDKDLPPVELAKTCRYFAEGYCRHGAQCWYRHEKSSQTAGSSSQQATDTTPTPESSSVAEDSESGDWDSTCGICFETPGQFGLLMGCSHVFCLECLRDWRKSVKKEASMVISNIIKTCPLCRQPSRYITPSSQFYPQGDPMKDKMISNYKETMSKIPCRYFLKSVPGKRFCPYGYDCFFKHEEPSGERVIFTFGVDKMLAAFKDELALQRRTGRRRNRPYDLQFFLDEARMHETFDQDDDPLDLLGMLTSPSNVDVENAIMRATATLTSMVGNTTDDDWGPETPPNDVLQEFITSLLEAAPNNQVWG